MPRISGLGLGDALVLPFGGRAITALAVVIGLALLDLGPRASAAFLPVVSSTPQIDSVVGETADSGAPETGRDYQVWPPTSADVRVVNWAHCGSDAPSSG